MILLEKSKIQSYLTGLQFVSPYELHCLRTIDSTNHFVSQLESECPFIVCCAEEQTAGRGRLGRQWSSPFGENIYFSARWRPDRGLMKYAGLSLVIGLAISETLKQHNIEESILIKWPNDLMWQDKKLCGVLIEMTGENVIIGIGLNVNTAKTSTSYLSDKPWCSLLEITGQPLDRNVLIASLIVTLSHYLEQFSNFGFTSFKSAWEHSDYLKDQWIAVSKPTGKLEGQAKGLNDQGLLCLVDINGQIHWISAGEATILR